MWPLLRLWIGSKDALRILCLMVVAGWVLAIAIFAVSFVAAANGARAFLDWLSSWPVLVTFGLVFCTVGAAELALTFRRCARCSKPLFDGRGGRSFDLTPDIRHHRAKSFMNSYRKGAIVELVRTGSLNCSHCGHELGTTPDYVVTAPE